MTRIFSFFQSLAVIVPLSVSADTIELSDGRIFHGGLAGSVGGYLSIIVGDSNNQAELRYRLDEIERIEFSDSISRQDAIDGFSKRHPSESTALLENLALKRLPYLELLSPEDESIFTYLLESYILTGRAVDALERAKLWLSKLPSSEAKLRGQELQIIAAWNLDRPSESAYYGRQWIEAGQSCQTSALPWVTLANIALIEDDYETALWIALNPIVFSPPSRPPYLEEAYAIAIISAFKTGERALAHQLKSEMRDLEFVLPKNFRWSAPLADADRQSEDGSRTENRSNQFKRNANPIFKLIGKP